MKKRLLAKKISFRGKKIIIDKDVPQEVAFYGINLDIAKPDGCIFKNIR